MASKRFAAEDFDEWSNEADKKKKKKRSRWGENVSSESSVMSGLPTVIPQGLTKDQEEQYLYQLQIEEMTRRLKTGELGIPPNPEDRSPSPEPIYNNEGKRLNTREFRTRKKLEEERHNVIQKVLKVNPDYKPPADYRPPLIRIHDKVMIPQDDHPEINFVGLLIGPRGNTLRSLEKETGTSIIIRGKGSVKEGKVGHKDGKPLPGQDEPLHAYITANSYDNVKTAVKRIKEIIEEGINVPDAENDLRKQQLRELALLNGTLREGDALSKLKQFQEAQTIVTNTILCTICGGAGHISADCKQKRPGESLKEMAMNPVYNLNAKAKMDNEYMSLMAELGQGSAPPPHPNSVRMRAQLQLPEPRLTVQGGQLAITGGPSWTSAPPPPGPPAPPQASSSSQPSSNGSPAPPWKPNSAGPMCLPPPVRPPPPGSSFWPSPSQQNSAASGSDRWSGSQAGSGSGGHVWSNAPTSNGPPSSSSDRWSNGPLATGSTNNSNSSSWSSSGQSCNSGGSSSWNSNTGGGGFNSSSPWDNLASRGPGGNMGSWSSSSGQGASGNHTWSSGPPTGTSGGSGGSWGNSGMMSWPPVPPAPPSFSRWGSGPPPPPDNANRGSNFSSGFSQPPPPPN